MTEETANPPTDGPPRTVPGKAGAAPVRTRPGGPTQDELLDEALKETFPASDPTSVYRLY
jgi:hypothetical protein